MTLYQYKAKRHAHRIMGASGVPNKSGEGKRKPFEKPAGKVLSIIFIADKSDFFLRHRPMSGH